MKINLGNLAHRPAPIRIIAFLSCLLVVWLPIAIPIYLLIKDYNLVTILTMGLLAIAFFIFLPHWGKMVHQEPHMYSHVGLEFTRKNGVELIRGLAIGLISIQLLFLIQGGLGWLEWQKPSTSLTKLIIEAIPTALGTGLAEELLFRGWIYDELERDYKPSIVLWGGAILFPVSHFIKPIPEIIRTSPQFFGLLLLALTCIWAKRLCRGRLGLSIGIHAGLVWGWYVVNVGRLIKYTGNVPVWITGVNENPLAGIMGLIFLLILSLWMWRKNLTFSRNSV
ncbi:type II CAAX endopeptidase family protein [Brunnivagina elsteri]|uniref:CPBP family intramembrane metalloprotease n=1 Tax=Brunnivagina elsteri CCALA 953 TaxID=987040 RepID=A0A2A2TP51_9CYAN|nr:type II CAAX endopeptidase family protein [Calothrix elsteri]PAX60205.1 CPBP family intramembrane metalloprotease [Calothrix elsteri CCALA 953]